MVASARRALIICISLGALQWAYAASALAADEPTPTLAGFAERDITPEIGMERPGGYGKGFHTRLHDPCKVRAAVFDDGQQAVAIVGLDALLIRRVVVLAAREKIHERCGIRPECIMISASHSHSSGPVGMVLPGEYDHASQFVQELAYEKSSMADAGYLAKVEQAIVEAVCEAHEKRQAAQCGVGYGVEDRVAFNRRFRMRSGLTQTHPRQGNPDIVEPAGPTDPQVGVIGAWSSEGKLLGCVVNFACHATTSPPGISANYIHYLEKAIRGSLADDAIVVFVPGASGDVTQVDNLNPYQAPGGEESAQIVGGRVGAEAVKVLLGMHRGALAPTVARQQVLRIERRPPNPQRVERCLQIVKSESSADATEWTFAKEIVLLDARMKKEPVADVEIQAIQVGPAVLLSVPAEYFCQYGLDIKAGSPFEFTFPVSLANGCVGYVPTEEAFGPRGGGYETRLTSYSNLVPDAGTRMANTAIALSRQLTPGGMPTRPPAPPFQGGAWTYGELPPELE